MIYFVFLIPFFIGSGLALNDCRTSKVKMMCKVGAGDPIFNFGHAEFWNPATEETHDIYRCTDQECKPCCTEEGEKTIAACPETDIDGWECIRALKELRIGQVGGWRGNVEKDLHCPLDRKMSKCKPGPGSRIFNTGENGEWNPANNIIAGMDLFNICIPCCLDEGYSIGLCPERPEHQDEESSGQIQEAEYAEEGNQEGEDDENVNEEDFTILEDLASRYVN